MINIKHNNLDEKQLLRYFRALNHANRETLLRFAAFLAASSTQVEQVTPVLTPLAIERPAQESVVKAIQRLRATYPMLDPDKLLHKTSDLMSAHVIKGLPAVAVIDELEVLFADAYQQFQSMQANL